MRGGYRTGAGRKQGFAAKNAEEARRYLSQRVAEEIGPIADKLIEKAKDGDMRALQMLFDRAWGKPRQEIQLLDREQEQAPENEGRLKKLTNKINELLRRDELEVLQ